MKKGWKIVGTLVLVLVLLGSICVGVGFMTGGDVEDIYSTLNARYNLSGYWTAYSQWVQTSYHQILEAVPLR